LGANLRVRSCRYMPPEDYADFGEQRLSRNGTVGARTYSDIMRRHRPATGHNRHSSQGFFKSFRGLLQRLKFS